MQQHVTIIGCGIIGLSIAVKLKQQGFQITLVDREGIAEGTSKGNAGHFATEQVFPLADPALLPQLPKMLLDPYGPFRIAPRYLPKALPWFVRFLAAMRSTRRAKNTQALQQLNQHALDALKPYLAITNSQTLYQQDGALLVYEDKNCASAMALQRAYQSQDVSVQFLDRNAIGEMEPNLSKHIHHALFFDQVAHTLCPYRLCQQYWQFLSKNDAQFIRMDAKHIQVSEKGVQVSDGIKTVTSDKLVIAAGAYSKPLVSQLGYTVPLETERGYHLMIDSKDTLSRPVTSAERKFIMTSMLDGLRLAGTVEFAGLEAPPNYQRAHMLRHHAEALIPSLKGSRTQAQWIGYRPSFPDSLPVIDQSHRHPDVFFAFGHQHLGLTQSAITADLISSLIRKVKLDIDLSPYRINRFHKSN